jgi:excinuclease UvrABC ATPase subunit
MAQGQVALFPADDPGHRDPLRVRPKAKWKDLPEAVQEVFLRGSGETEIQFRYDEGGRVYQVKRSFEGVIPNMERRYRETDSAWIREEFERYQNNRPCGACGGYRLRPEALAVKIADLHVGQVVQMSIREAYAWCENVPARLSQQKNEIARAILKEIRERLGFLNNVGLEYLTLSPQRRHALGRREPADPAGLPDRLGPDRRPLRPRRAFHRPAPARQ